MVRAIGRSDCQRCAQPVCLVHFIACFACGGDFCFGACYYSHECRPPPGGTLLPGDREMRELTALLEALAMGGCCGGLSVPPLLASEILVSRILRTTDVYVVPGMVGRLC